MDQSKAIEDLIDQLSPVSKESVETVTKSNVDVSKPDSEIKPESVTSPAGSQQEEIKIAPIETKVPTANSFPATAKTKIPGLTRKTNKSSLSLKNTNSPRTPISQRSTPRIDSQLSLNKNDSFVVKKTNETTPKANTARGLIKKLPCAPERKYDNRSVSNASSRNSGALTKAEKETNLRKIASSAGDQNRMHLLEKKLRNAQTEFLKQIQGGGKERSEYKLIAVVRNEECKLLIKDDYVKKMPQKLTDNSIHDFKEKIQNYLDEYFATINSVPKEMPESEQSFEEKLQESQDFNTKKLFEFIDDLCNSYKNDANQLHIENMEKELKDSRKALRTTEMKLNILAKKHEEELLNLKNELSSKAACELASKEVQIKELQKKIKTTEKQMNIFKINLQNIEKEEQTEKANLQEELHVCQESLNSLEKKLQNSEQVLSQEREELKKKSEFIKTMEATITDKCAKIEEYEQVKQNANNKIEDLLKQINELEDTIKNLETEKCALQKANEQLMADSSSKMDMLKNLQESQARIRNLEEQLVEKDKSKDSKAEFPKHIQEELAKLRQSDAEKRREIEKLKVELAKSIRNVSQLEEQIQRDQQLLEVRSELINSLQTNETNQRLHMEDLFVQVGEKNSTITELNNELSAKSDEFRNLFETISNKQLELSNQEHMIKLLEESNERSQMLRVKQEEKIGRLEEDIAHLKQTIAIYQANALNSNGKLLFAPVMPRNHDDCNENFYYYTSERKRKRQVDINVKKYEA